MNNTIILLKGHAMLTESEYKRFSKHDTIYGDDRTPEEVKRYSMEQIEEAKKELAKYNCKYDFFGNSRLWEIEEYALEYCECDEDGEWISGSDYDFAEEEKSIMAFYVNYGTGTGNEYIQGSLDDAKKAAEENLAYTQQSVRIQNESGKDVAVLPWYDTEPEEDDVVTARFGESGFYGEWYEV